MSCLKDTEVSVLYTLEETIAKDIFDGVVYPWEVLSKIKDFIVTLGNTLPEEVYEKKGDNVWIARSADVSPSACINGPAIIDEEAQIRHCAFIRGSAIVGKGAVVGNSTELKNVILFNKVQVPHYNYVGDSILGYKAHMGAGSITSNVKSDKTLGCNSVLNPGTVIGKHANVYPTSMVRGFIPADSIYKRQGEIAAKY